MASSETRAADGERDVVVSLDGFAWDAISEESTRSGVSVQEIVAYSVMYYLADADSGRFARRISPAPYPEAGASL